MTIARTIAHVIGADSPTAQVLMLMNPLQAGAEGGIVGGVRRVLKLYHNSPDVFPSGKPTFDAFLGSDDFRKAFKNEWGPHTYEITMPEGSRVLDVAGDTLDARRMRVAMAKRTWPDDTAYAQELEGGVNPVDPDDLYELWTDKDTVMGAMSDAGLRDSYDLVQNGAEYVAPREVLDRSTGRAFVEQPIKAYQGSPHDFAAERLIRHSNGQTEYLVGLPDVLPDVPPGATVVQDFPLGRHRAEKIGTGEGNAAYGDGHYVGEVPDTGRGYRDQVPVGERAAGNRPDTNMRIGGVPVTDVYSRIDRNAARLPINQARAEYDKLAVLEDLMLQGDALGVRERGTHGPEAMAWFESEVVPKFTRKGGLYEVNIHADPADFLDWDAPLSQQSEKVKKILAENGIFPRQTSTGGIYDPPGAVAYSAMGKRTGAEALSGPEWARTATDPQVSSESLRNTGIPGIKYLDAGSRAVGDGTRNYVIAPGNEHLIEIMRKFGVTLPMAKQLYDKIQAPMPSHEGPL